MQLTECPECHSKELPAYLDRHMARHARLAREFAEHRESDARITAVVGPSVVALRMAEIRASR